jgi:hypothetical protein
VRFLASALAAAAGLTIAFNAAAETPPTGPRPTPADTVEVSCTVGPQASLMDCSLVHPERLTEAERARVLQRAASATTDPSLRPGEQRVFGIPEATRDFTHPPATAPHVALVREDSLVGVGQCVWEAIGALGQSDVAASLKIGASMQVTRQTIEAQPQYAAILARCDPNHASHVDAADMVIPAYAMKASSRDQLARNQIPESSLRAALGQSPELQRVLELRTIAVLRNATEPTPLDWGPYLARLHLITGDPRIRYAELFFQAEAIENVLIYQQLKAW